MAQKLVTGLLQDLTVSLSGLPSKIEAKSIYLLSLSGNNQILGMNPHAPMSLFEMYFTCKTKDLSLFKDFKPNQSVTLEIKVNALGNSNNKNIKNEITYKLSREVYSLSSMETTVYTNDDYLYKLVLGHPEAPLANLTATIESARYGNIKDILQAVLTDANVTKVDLDNLKSGFLTSPKRWYYQRESHWSFIVNELLAPNGLTAYLDESNTLVFIENEKAYEDAEFSPWVTASSPVDDKNVNPLQKIVLAQLHTLRSVETYMPVQTVNVSSHKADSKDTIYKGEHKGDNAQNVKLFSYLHGNFDNQTNNDYVAKQQLANATWQGKIFMGESTIPVLLGKKIDRPKDADSKDPTDKTLIPAALSIHCSFYNFPANPQQINLQYFTGLAPHVFSFSATLVPSTVMPQLTYQPKNEPPIFLEGVVVSASGEKTGNPAPGKNKNMLYIGLFAENKQGQSFTVVEMQGTENFSLENSTPHPGTKVLVAYLPSLGRFYYVGKIRMNDFKNEMWLKTSAEKTLPSYININDDSNMLDFTNGKKKIMMNTADMTLLTEDNTSITLNKDLAFQATNIKSTAKSGIEINATSVTTKASSKIKNTASSIESN